jgi:5-formyltetrahydrofolate cyclo-ligase
VNGERTTGPIHDPRASTRDLRAIKADIRRQVLARRDALDAAERAAFSARITGRLTGLAAYRNAACVMAYVGFGGELDTAAFIADVLARGKRLVLPRVTRGARDLGLHVVRDPATQLEAGVWGIRQPRPDLCAPAAPADIDFVLVPGVAFTARCERLGYGGGFYDRFIGGLTRRPALVAGAFSLQIVAELPMSASDQRVDLVITEDAVHDRIF